MQTAQLIHAAGESSPGNLPRGTYAIALHAANQGELLTISDALDEANIPHHCIIESDEPYRGQIMAIGIPPMDRKNLKRILSWLPLIK